MENEDQSQENAQFTAPTEKTEGPEEAEEFIVFNAPEIPEGGQENHYKKGDNQKHIIEDPAGREIYHRETTEKSDWHRKIGYDDAGQLSTIDHQKLTPGQESHTVEKFEYDKEKWYELVSKTGSIEFGPDAGHVYRELPPVEKNLGDGKFIYTTTTEILEQGNNGSGKRAEKGTVFTKTVYMKYGQWQGEKVTGTDSTESTQFPDDIDKLPDWE